MKLNEAAFITRYCSNRAYQPDSELLVTSGYEVDIITTSFSLRSALSKSLNLGDVSVNLDARGC